MSSSRKSTDDKQIKRFLRILSNQLETGCNISRANRKVTLFANTRRYNFCEQLFKKLVDSDLCSVKGNRVHITSAGQAKLKRYLYPDHEYSSQHGNFAYKSILVDGTSKSVLTTDSESPLARLASRKDKYGKTWLNADEFQAGERFRRDFERAQLQPRISANWEASVADVARGSSIVEDLSDFAIDAKTRITKAIEYLGPELSQIILDICGFLKGLETVESENGWPPRSAKLQLRTALRCLMIHYGMNIRNNKQAEIRYWSSSSPV